jgi:capsular exopolysaccharide synthesis family protein
MSSIATPPSEQRPARPNVFIREEPDINDYWSLARRSLPVCVLLTVLGIGLGILLSVASAPSYISSAQVLVRTNSASSVNDVQKGNEFSASRLKTYAELVTTSPILEDVIHKGGLNTTVGRLAEHVRATPNKNATIITITTTGDDAAGTAALASSFADSLIELVGRIENPSGQIPAPVSMTSIQEGESSVARQGPDVASNVVLGGASGLALAFFILLTRSLLDTSIRDRRELAQISDIPVLATFPWDAGVERSPLAGDKGPRHEAFQTLRTNLRFVGTGMRTRNYLFTSSVTGEGKTSTAVNIGIALARSGSRVLLVDADLRQPSLARLLDIEGEVGLSNVLAGSTRLDDCVQEWGGIGLCVLPAGRIPPNPSELLGSSVMSDLVGKLAERFDVVIYDTPPLLPVTDAAVLAKYVDDVVLVVAVGSTGRQDFTQALETVGKVGAKVVGLVVTEFEDGGSAKRRARQASYSAAVGLNG